MGCFCSKETLAEKVSSTEPLSQKERLAGNETIAEKENKLGKNNKPAEDRYSAKKQHASGYHPSIPSTSSFFLPTANIYDEEIQRARQKQSAQQNQNAQQKTNGMGHQDGTIATNDYAPAPASKSHKHESASGKKTLKADEGQESGHLGLEEVGGTDYSTID